MWCVSSSRGQLGAAEMRAPVRRMETSAAAAARAVRRSQQAATPSSESTYTQNGRKAIPRYILAHVGLVFYSLIKHHFQ